MLPQTGGLVGCLAQLTADQSSMCQTGLSPGAPNGAPFSCLVGGGVGGIDRRDEGTEERRGGGCASRKTDRKSLRMGGVARQAEKRGTSQSDTGKKIIEDRQIDGHDEKAEGKKFE